MVFPPQGAIRSTLEERAREEIRKQTFVPSLEVSEGEIYYVSSGTALGIRDLRVDGLMFVDGEIHLFGDLKGNGELKGAGEILVEV